MRIFTGILIVTLTTVAGVRMGRIYKLRLDEINRLEIAVSRLEGMTLGLGYYLPRALSETGQDIGAGAGGWLEAVGKNMSESSPEHPDKLWTAAYETVSSDIGLNKIELSAFARTAGRLGRGIESEDRQIYRLLDKEIEKLRQRAMENDKKYNPLCSRLGLLSGLLTALILI